MDEDYEYGYEYEEEGERSEGEFEYGEEEETRSERGESEFPEDYEFAEEGEGVEMAEINAFERATISTLSSYGLKSARNPKEKYRILLTAAMDKIGAHLTAEDKSAILQSVALRDDIIYRNPYTYILGYIGSRGGRGITSESMKKAFGDIEAVYGIEQPDVVRYSIFWVNMTKK